MKFFSDVILDTPWRTCQFKVFVLTRLFPQQNTFKYKTEVTSYQILVGKKKNPVTIEITCYTTDDQY